MNREDWLEQAELYALGALDPEARLLFERHLQAQVGTREGGALEQKVRETQEALVLFDKALPQEVPDPRTGQSLFVRIEAESQKKGAAVPAAGGIFSSHRLCAGITACLMVALVWNYSTSRREIFSLQQSLDLAKNELLAVSPIMKLVADERTRIVELKGLEASPAASAYVFWNPQTRQGFFSGRRLPQLDRQKVYELWALAGSQPVRAGIFQVDGRGAASFYLPGLPTDRNYDTFAVTLEPAGGTDQPSGAMHLAGRV